MRSKSRPPLTFSRDQPSRHSWNATIGRVPRIERFGTSCRRQRPRFECTPRDVTRPRFRALLQAFGDASGIPCLVNTSFNGFHEPIVCTPRDAVRVFYGSGLDVFILDRFVLTK